MAKSPALADRYRTDEAMDVVEALTDLARERDNTLPELAISWLAGRPAVAIVITGASRPEQIRANVAAAVGVLDDGTRAAIDQITAHEG